MDISELSKRPLSAVLFLTALAFLLLQGAGASSAVQALILLPAGGLCLTAGRREASAYLILLIVLTLSQINFLISRTLSLPFESSRAVQAEIRLLAEPVWDGRGRLRLSGELVTLEDSGGSRAGASGRIAAVMDTEDAPGAEDWFRDDRLSLKGSLYQGRGGYRLYASRVVRHSREGGASIRIALQRGIRRRARRLGGDSAVLLPALVLGMRDPSLEGTASLFRETGCAHIIALSGFHSGLVALLLYLLLKKAVGHRPALAGSAAGLFVYLWMAGPKPSLFRAVLMYTLFVSGRLVCRRGDGKRILAASYLLTALIAPASVHSLSARLSYLALWGILDSSPVLFSLLETRLPRFLALPLSAGLAAQLWTLPLVLFSFGVWYPAGIAASLILAPLISLYMYGGILYLALPSLPAAIVAPLCRLLERGVVICAGIFRSFPSLAGEWGEGVFFFLIFPLLLGLVYRPGGFNGKRKIRSQLRFYLGDKIPSGYDGAGPPQEMGAELSG